MGAKMLYMSHNPKSTFKEAKIRLKSALLAALLLLERMHVRNDD